MSRKQSLLWELKATPSSTSSFLFGTMHTWNEASFQVLDALSPFIESTNYYFAEYDLSETTAAYETNPFLLPNQLSLKQLFSEKRYTKIRNSLLKAFEVDINAFQQFYPIVVVNQVTQQVLQQQDARSLDGELWKKAAVLGLERKGVETLDEQIQTLHAIPLSLQLKQLKEVSQNVKKYRQQILRLSAIYLNQDIHTLYKITKKQSGALRKLLIYERNEIMADRIVETIKQESIFVAIGAGHLSGQRGVIHLLKKRNISVKPVKIFERAFLPEIS